MAEIAFRPDEKLALLEEQLRKTKDANKAANIREQIAARTAELMKSGNMPAAGFGGEGYYAPSLNVYSSGDVQNRAYYERQEALKKELAGKVQLLPQGETGIFRAQRFNPDGTTTDISQSEGSKLTFYDAQGNPLTPAQVAATATGQQYAEAGWDIGFGKGQTGGITATGKKTGTFGQYGKFDTADASVTPAESFGNQQAALLAAEEKRRQGQSAYNLLLEQFSQYGLGALVQPLQDLIVQGLSPAEFTLRLRDTQAYKNRFAANAQRMAKGLRALSEAEYIGLEDQYQNVMRNYGLPANYYTRGDMGRQEGFEKFIAGDVSAAELEDRIQTAQNRVINAAPEVSRALREFYPGISNGDILAYALDPDKALTDIRRKVTAAEIGAGAMQAGLATGVTRAEELQRFGVTGEQARAGFQAISDILPRGRQLSEIYGKQGMGAYTQTTAEQEVFGLTGAAEAGRQRRKLTELEQAAFSGQAGAAGGALARDRAGAF